MKSKTELCPCCGFELKTKLDKEICPACFHLPEKDPAPQREWWSSIGSPWMSTRRNQPKNWDAVQNMARLALNVTMAKVKGRPPIS